MFTGPASATEAGCDLDNGYSSELASYVAEATSCVSSADNIESDIAAGLFDAINAERESRGLQPLVRRASLDMAAQAHALDMSVRIYADHMDPEGRDHLHRIRAFDRTMLVGASGSNVTVSLANADVQAVHETLKRDSLNTQNMTRRSFTDVGIGVVEEAGQYYVVQVFAAAEGDFKREVPLTATRSQPLSARFLDRDRQVVAWGLVDVDSGELLSRSTMPRVRFGDVRGTQTAALDVAVSARNDTYVLKGPLVSGR